MYPITLDLDFLGWGEIPGYEGFYYFLAFLVSILVFRRRIVNMGITSDQLNTFLLILIPMAMIGAKYFDLIGWHWSELTSGKRSFWSYLHPANGGASVTGGIVMGVLGAWLFCRWKKIHVGSFFDRGAPVIGFGDCVGRMGCFMNGDSHGSVTDLPWGFPVPAKGEAYSLVIPYDTPPSTNDLSQMGHLVIDEQYWGLSVHPTQLYEALGVLMIGLMIIFIVERRGWLQNRLVWLFSLCYGILRFFIEFQRSDAAVGAQAWIAGLSNGQVISIVMVILGITGMIFFKGMKPADWYRLKGVKAPGDRPAPKSTSGKPGQSKLKRK